MALIGTLNQAVAGNVISSSEYNQNMDSIRDAFNNTAVLTDVARNIEVQHTFAPGAAQAPFALNANAQGQLVTGLNSDQLDSQEGSFYQNASNINAGTLAEARLPSTVVLTGTAKTISAVHTFNPSVAGAPFTLGANATGQLVSGLNADQLDGNEGSFYQDASNLTAGTLPSGRLSGAYGGVTGVGTLTSLTMGGNITPDVNNTHNLGSSALRWANGYLSSLDVSGAVTFGGSLSWGGGETIASSTDARTRLMIDGWRLDNIAASSTTTADRFALSGGSSVYWVPTRGGSITAIAAHLSGSISAGTITLEVQKWNGTGWVDTGATLTFGSADNPEKRATFSFGTYTFNAPTNMLKLVVKGSSDLSPTSVDLSPGGFEVTLG